jgi:hypothetical protein
MEPVGTNGQSDSSYSNNAHLRDGSTHPFLSSATGADALSFCQGNTIVNLSNTVEFSFRALRVPHEYSFQRFLQLIQCETEDLRGISHQLELTHGSKDSFPLSMAQIIELMEGWTARKFNLSPSTATQAGQPVKAFFWFRTYCRQEDWHIRREMNCITWTPQAIRLLNPETATELENSGEEIVRPIQLNRVRKAFSQLRQLFGKHSVMYALYDTNLILSHASPAHDDESELLWAPPSLRGIEEAAIAQYRRLFHCVSQTRDLEGNLFTQSARDFQLHPSGQPVDTPVGFPLVPESMGGEGAILAKKPNYWAPQSPRYCLFVWRKEDFDDKARLRYLLHRKLKEREVVSNNHDTAAHDQPQLQPGDAKAEVRLNRAMLTSWLEELDGDPMEIGDG